MADKSKSMMRNGHFVLSKNKEQRPTVSFLTQSMLSTSGKDLVDKGIKVPAGETFHYCQPAEESGIYIFEAGFGPGHAGTVKENVHVYITCGEKKLLVGTLSSQLPSIKLNLMMSWNFQLTHSATRKSICFNAWQFSPVTLSDCLLNSYKEFWVREVKPLKGITFDPMADGKKYHILRIFLGTITEESIDINVQLKDTIQKIGTLLPDEASLSCNLEYDEKFALSHTSKVADIIAYGYTVPYFSLKELPGPPSDKFNLSAIKVCVDPEYKAFVKLREEKKATT